MSFIADLCAYNLSAELCFPSFVKRYMPVATAQRILDTSSARSAILAVLHRNEKHSTNIYRCMFFFSRILHRKFCTSEIFYGYYVYIMCVHCEHFVRVLRVVCVRVCVCEPGICCVHIVCIV